MQIPIDFNTIVKVTEVLFGIVVNVSLVPFFNNRYKVVFEYEFPMSEIKAVNALARNTFPERFLFGVASSFQTESIEDDAGENGFSREYYRNCSFPIHTCDSSHNYVEDIPLVQSVEAKMYKISLCWSNILPNGFAGPVNETNIEHYRDIIEEMLANGITPMVTLLERDTPYAIQQLGGWTNRGVVEWFETYAQIAFAVFGDKVKYWVTIDDPVTLCTRSYGNVLNPSASLSGVADYMCGHHVLLAHAKVYNLYQKKFRPIQKGKVGIIQSYTWFEPDNADSRYDMIAAEIGFQWYNGWLTNPVFGKNGGYPQIMKDRIDFKSRILEFFSSRLPSFTDQQINEIKGAADFLGVNFHRTYRIRGRAITFNDDVSFNSDANIEVLVDNRMWLGEAWVKNTAWAFGKLLRRLNNNYVLPEIFITGNGYGDGGQIQDIGRIVYYHEHITEVLKTMQLGIDIRGYLASSLLDNFKFWNDHEITFGLFYKNISNSISQWHPKLSASIISDIYKTRTIRPIANVLDTSYGL